MGEADPPTLPESRLAGTGWTLSRTEAETVFEGLGVSVTGHTAIYEDEDLRERIVAAGGEDRVWRFFFASRLDITPSPGFGMASVARPYVVRESKAAFVEELRERGFEDIAHGDTETVRLGEHRARMTPHRARLPLDDTDVGVLGAVVVWHDGHFHVAGGAYPTTGLQQWVETDPDAYESELLDLIRAVE
ncbi:hypothetical protein [Natronomonas marina]|uniref:hypothetical protein n=1 Tax=Natronomonas marina TaxID=2961939 RepID=UPI0020C99A20|nr:hypothetical protein [Natronomonas marina]